VAISLVRVTTRSEGEEPRRSLDDVLREAQRRGSLGDRPIDEVIDHARQFLVPLAGLEGRVLDLGTGAGVPGLVIADARPDLRLTLLDRRAARMDALRLAVSGLRVGDRVKVVTGEADSVARDPAHAGRYVAVVARGYGSPEVTARDARPFLFVGGILVVSEPPDRDPDRWPDAMLERLGYGPAERVGGVVRIPVMSRNP